MHHVIFILFSPNEQRGGGGGRVGAARLFFVFFFSLFSRPRAGSVTVKSSFLGLATNTLNVRNNRRSKCVPIFL